MSNVFVCTGRPRLNIDAADGKVLIRGWDGDEVRIDDDRNAEVHNKGDKIFVDCSGTCDLKIYLPRQSDVYIDGSNLEVDMAGINGFASVDVTSRPVLIEDWQGELEVDTSDGDIKLLRINGQAELDTSSGNVEIESCDGSFGIDTGAGSVTILDSRGSVSADTSGGSITLRGFKGPVTIDTGAGDVQLRDISGRNVYVDSGRGKISASLPGSSPGRWQLDAGTGDIDLSVPENISAKFELEGADINVEDLGLEQYWQEDDKISGILNDGQGVVIASTAGTITATKKPAESILDSEPVPIKDDESLKILTMLEQGTITTAEAEKLLDALRGGSDDE